MNDGFLLHISLQARSFMLSGDFKKKNLSENVLEVISWEQ